MKNHNIDSMSLKEVNKCIEKVQKLACNRKVTIPGYATVRAYRAKSGKRMFAITSVKYDAVCPSGNLPLHTVISDIKHCAYNN